MRDFTDNDILDLEIKYKDNHEVLDLIAALKDSYAEIKGLEKVDDYEGQYEELKSFLQEIKDEIDSAIATDNTEDLIEELSERIEAIL